jgi:hypothetical protein
MPRATEPTHWLSADERRKPSVFSDFRASKPEKHSLLRLPRARKHCRRFPTGICWGFRRCGATAAEPATVWQGLHSQRDSMAHPQLRGDAVAALLQTREPTFRRSGEWLVQILLQRRECHSRSRIRADNNLGWSHASMRAKLHGDKTPTPALKRGWLIVGVLHARGCWLCSQGIALRQDETLSKRTAGLSQP